MPDDGSLPSTLWIGGAQWAGKTTVAQLVAVRHPVVLYAYDYHDARSHAERSRAEPQRFPHRAALLAALDRDPDQIWVWPRPEEMAASALQSFAERFEMVLEDLRGMPRGVTVLAEGWGLRPDYLAPLLDRPERAVFLVPSEAFRQRQLQELPRAGAVGVRVSDPARAQRNRIERDRLLADDVVSSARRHGLRVMEVDGT
ncbi:MAG TPA: hypothetical protein VFA70_10310, partial [Dehalococcoidia bacterium]|nr:hypothetical protein [Dehalococcoidia bacterium]